MASPRLDILDMFRGLAALPDRLSTVEDSYRPKGRVLADLGRLLVPEQRDCGYLDSRLQLLMGVTFRQYAPFQGHEVSDVFRYVRSIPFEVTDEHSGKPVVEDVRFVGVSVDDLDAFGPRGPCVNLVEHVMDITVDRENGHLKAFSIERGYTDRWFSFKDLVRVAIQHHEKNGDVAFWKGVYHDVVGAFPDHYRADFYQKVPFMRQPAPRVSFM